MKIIPIVAMLAVWFYIAICTSLSADTDSADNICFPYSLLLTHREEMLSSTGRLRESMVSDKLPQEMQDVIRKMEAIERKMVPIAKQAMLVDEVERSVHEYEELLRARMEALGLPYVPYTQRKGLQYDVFGGRGNIEKVHSDPDVKRAAQRALEIMLSTMKQIDPITSALLQELEELGHRLADLALANINALQQFSTDIAALENPFEDEETTAYVKINITKHDGQMQYHLNERPVTLENLDTMLKRLAALCVSQTIIVEKEKAVQISDLSEITVLLKKHGLVNAVLRGETNEPIYLLRAYHEP